MGKKKEKEHNNNIEKNNENENVGTTKEFDTTSTLQIEQTRYEKDKKLISTGYKEGFKEGFEAGFTFALNVCSQCENLQQKKTVGKLENKDVV